MQLSEAALVEKAQAGEPEAFADLVAIHQRFVFNLALRAVNDPIEAEDVAQEAFIRAWQGLPRFRGQSQFRTWLYRIVVNLCYNRLPNLRKELTQVSVEEMDDTENLYDGPLVTAGANPPLAIENRQRQAFLQQQIACLPDSMRMMMLLRYQQDMPYEEIAEVLAIPLGTVKTGLFRAKLQLREALRKNEEVSV